MARGPRFIIWKTGGSNLRSLDCKASTLTSAPWPFLAGVTPPLAEVLFFLQWSIRWSVRHNWDWVVMAIFWNSSCRYTKSCLWKVHFGKNTVAAINPSFKNSKSSPNTKARWTITWLILIILYWFMDLSLPYLFALGSFIGSFATRYFSHLFDLSRFATSLFFAVVRQLTVNYHWHSSVTFNPFCNVGILNVDFSWFLKVLSILVRLASEVQNRFIYGNNVNNSSYMHIYGFNLLFMCLFSVILKCVYFYK